jgi:hypothetical protein
VRTKSAYRKPAGNNPPAVEAAIAPAPEAPTVAVEVRPEIEPQPDETAEALRRQVEALRQSEQLLKQGPQALPQQPPTREQLLDQWRRQGVSDANLKFLEANPELIDGWQLTFHAANEARQRGHEPNTDAHREATKEIFHHYLAEAEKQTAQAQTPTDAAMTSTPKFFEPPPAPKPRTAPSIVSAPVSREVPSGGPRPEFEENPTRVVLSAAEKEIARASKISEVEYARNKIRMMRMKASGEIQG